MLVQSDYFRSSCVEAPEEKEGGSHGGPQGEAEETGGGQGGGVPSEGGVAPGGPGQDLIQPVFHGAFNGTINLTINK